MVKECYLFKTTKVFPDGRVKTIYKTGSLVNGNKNKELAIANNNLIYEVASGEVQASLDRLNALNELYGFDSKHLEQKELSKIYNRFLTQEQAKLKPKEFILFKNIVRAMRRSRQELQDTAESNIFNWFITLTFDKNKVGGNEARLNEKVTKDLYIKWRRMIKQKFPSAYYITVPEYHKKGGLHFHILMGGVTAKDLQLQHTDLVCCHWARKKVMSKAQYELEKDKHTLMVTDGLTIYNVSGWKLGWSTVTRIASQEATTYYVTKYLTKGGIDIRFHNQKRFYTSHNIIKPIITKENVLIGKADFDLPEDKLKTKLQSLVNNYNIEDNTPEGELVYRSLDNGYYIFESEKEGEQK
jgi:hypothetical protein